MKKVMDPPAVTDNEAFACRRKWKSVDKSLLLYSSPRNFGSSEKFLSEAIKKCLEAVLHLEIVPR